MNALEWMVEQGAYRRSDLRKGRRDPRYWALFESDIDMIRWIKKHPIEWSMSDFWRECPRKDWMLWAYSRAALEWRNATKHLWGACAQRTIERVVETHALHCGIPCVEDWAQQWLSRVDRSRDSPGIIAFSCNHWSTAAMTTMLLADGKWERAMEAAESVWVEAAITEARLIADAAYGHGWKRAAEAHCKWEKLQMGQSSEIILAEQHRQAYDIRTEIPEWEIPVASPEG